jgi:hypothetical protein
MINMFEKARSGIKNPPGPPQGLSRHDFSIRASTVNLVEALLGWIPVLRVTCS